MAYTSKAQATEPARSDVDTWPGRTLLEFGAAWCPICIGAQRDIRAALDERPELSHVKIEDGPGQPLGRSFRVKLWPTLILMEGGHELGRVVRPGDAEAVRQLISGAS